jgi:cyclophilin family peptidyl-prolyl cis-trans isomerase
LQVIFLYKLWSGEFVKSEFIMKKLIFLASLALIISGCTYQGGQQQDESGAVVEDTEGAREEGSAGEETEEDVTEEESASETAEEREESEAPKAQIVVEAPTQADVDALSESASVIIKTTKGDIVIELFTDRALTVANFLNLVKADFYDGVKFHRVIPDFMIQTGDPNSKDDDWSDDGKGGPGYTFPDEVTPLDNLVRGSIAMANAGPGTNGSQFFIVTKKEGTPWLNGLHTLFGKVVKGMEVADAISMVERDNDENNHPVTDVIVKDIVVRE